MLYFVPAVFSRFRLEKGRENFDETSAEDFTREERKSYLAELRQTVQKWCTVYVDGNQQYDRFRGPAV